MSIVIKQVNKYFGNFHALNNVSLEARPGTMLALLGPSGSGKSTLLRAIAGLEQPDSGAILIDGRDTAGLEPRQRNIGFVFQHYALFNHMTVRQNIAFGLAIRRSSRREIEQRVEELLNLIQLQGLGNRYPRQLSGGQRQRVALARALAIRPQVLLLDEPFGALDAKVRKELRLWLRRLHEEVGATSVFVTHDQEEAMELADEIVVMHQGRIEQVGTPHEIYDQPRSPFVMGFVGEVNMLPPSFSPAAKNGAIPAQVELWARPHDLELLQEHRPVALPATVCRVVRLGWYVDVEVVLPDGTNLTAQLSQEDSLALDLELGQQVFVRPRRVVSFAAAKVGTQLADVS